MIIILYDYLIFFLLDFSHNTNLIDTRSAGVGTGIYAGETWVRFPPKLIFTAVERVCFTAVERRHCELDRGDSIG